MVDITVHEVSTTGGLKEVHAASGGGWGGVLVDNSFKELLLELFGEAVYTTFVETNTEDWLELWRAFESKKKTVKPGSNASINMRIPVSLLKLFKQMTGREFEDMIDNSKYSLKIEVRGGDKIRFDNSLMKDMFNNSISMIVSHVTAVLQEKMARDVKAILMVGGFSDSAMLQEAIKREFKNVKVIIPEEASSSILRGAVIFGHNPKSISQRVLKKTYGIGINPKYKKGQHPEHLKTIIFGEERCKNVFDTHVEIDQSVNVGEPQVERVYYPIGDEQREVVFPVFASNLKDPLYTDQGCEYVGEFSVDISNVPKHLAKEDKKVLISLTFSGTEITATARVKETGETTFSSFDFLQ